MKRLVLCCDGTWNSAARRHAILHPSVLARWDADPGYRPESLKRYFARVGDPRGRS